MPSASLPAALGSDAEVQATYRLMNNPSVDFDAVLTPHIEETRKRSEEAREVIVLHDTTDCSFPHVDPRELGFLQTGKAGFRLHVSLAVDRHVWRRPLGVISAETLFRAKKRSRPKGRTSAAETTRWSDRESLRWERGMLGAAERLQGCKKVVHVADREGDSYELMAKLMAAHQSFVIRVRTDRRSRSVEDDADAGWSTVRQVANATEGTLEREAVLSRRKAKSAPEASRVHPPRKARIARLRFSATQIAIPRPRYLRDPIPSQLELNLVHVVELECPEGEPPVEWLLYTTEKIDTEEQVASVVDIYRTRWLIEEFNGALKTGTAYEDRQFESRHALMTMLALSLPIACEVLWLRSRARSCPDQPASEVVTRHQLAILRTLGSYKLPEHPTVEQALLAVAALGGHLKRNGPPGWKILQRGMALLLAYELAWKAARRKT